MKGSKWIDSTSFAYCIIEAFQLSVVNDDELSVEKEDKASGLESTLALLWALSRGLLTVVRLEDVPETTMMNHLIKGVRDRLAGRDTTNPRASADPTTNAGGSLGTLTSM